MSYDVEHNEESEDVYSYGKSQTSGGLNGGQSNQGGCHNLKYALKTPLSSELQSKLGELTDAVNERFKAILNSDDLTINVTNASGVKEDISISTYLDNEMINIEHHILESQFDDTNQIRFVNLAINMMNGGKSDLGTLKSMVLGIKHSFSIKLEEPKNTCISL